MGTYVDDTLCEGDGTFLDESKITEQTFEAQQREYNSFTFAGIQVEKDNGFL